MKKAFYLLVNLLLISQLSAAQSVTLATSTVNPTGGTVYYNNVSNQLQYWNGSAWIPITNAAAGTGWALNGNDILNANTGKVGIGTPTPKTAFNVAQNKTVLFGADSSGTGNKLIWYPSKGAFRVGYGYSTNWDYSNVGIYSTAMGSTTTASGYASTAMGFRTTASGDFSTAMGYGTTPSGYLSTALGSSTTASGFVSTAMGGSTTASGNTSTAMGGTTTASGDFSTAIGTYTKANNEYATAIGYGTIASGKFSLALGINTNATGYGSNSSGINTYSQGNYTTTMGDGTIASSPSAMAMGIYNVDVPNALLMVGKGTDFNSPSNALTIMKDGRTGINTTNPLATFHVEGGSYLSGNVGIGTSFPLGKIHVVGNSYLMGFVGIGTTAPIAPLHVAGSNVLASSSALYMSYGYNSILSLQYIPTGQTWATGLLVDSDIIGKRSIVSAQGVTTSDARIKNIIGLSDNQQDLAKVRQIKITDYRYKDVVTWGTQTFKKVIAQQVEEVYPQAVRKMTSTIPDIYSLAEKVVYDETNKKLTVSLSKNYEIRIDDKIEFIHEKQGKVQAIVESVSGNSFTVKDWQYPTDKIFVYGREVNDFRSVDYEAISMLGISAIQQLAKEVEELKNQNSKLKADFSARLEALEMLLVKSQTGK